MRARLLGVIGAVAVAALALQAQSARAQTQSPPQIKTAAELAANCKAQSPFCYGYMTGAYNFYQEVYAAGGISKIACPDSKVTLDGFRTVFVNWLEGHPQYQDEKPIDGLMRAAAATYPCPK